MLSASAGDATFTGTTGTILMTPARSGIRGCSMSGVLRGSGVTTVDEKHLIVEGVGEHFEVGERSVPCVDVLRVQVDRLGAALDTRGHIGPPCPGGSVPAGRAAPGANTGIVA